MQWAQFESEEPKSIKPPSHQYGSWYYFADTVSTPEVIKKGNPDSPCTTNVHLYTDGSSKGANFCGDEKGFSGWGCQMIVETPEGTQEISHNGGIFNADAHTAEVSAVLQALVRINGKCNIHIHSDSYYVISALADLPSFISNRRAAIEAQPEKRTRMEKIEHQRLGLWEMVQNEMNKHAIEQITIQWIKAHQMDDINFSDQKLSKEMLRDIKGNDTADKLSNIGVIKCVVDSLHELNKKQRFKPSQSELHIRIMAKNLAASYFTKETAIMYLVEKPNLLTPDIISRILDKESVDRIEAAIANGVSVKPTHVQLSKSIDSMKRTPDQKGLKNTYADSSPKA
jgi:ribonuclease HI